MASVEFLRFHLCLQNFDIIDTLLFILYNFLLNVLWKIQKRYEERKSRKLLCITFHGISHCAKCQKIRRHACSFAFSFFLSYALMFPFYVLLNWIKENATLGITTHVNFSFALWQLFRVTASQMNEWIWMKITTNVLNWRHILNFAT